MNKETSKREQNILYGVLSNYSSSILILFGTMIFTPVLVRLISTEQYGNLSTVLSVHSIVGPLATVGMFNSIRKHYPIANESGLESQLTTFSFVFLISIGIATTVSSWLVIFIMDGFNFIESVLLEPLLIVFFATIFNNCIEYSRSVLYSKSEEAKAEIIKIFKKFLYFGPAIFVSYLGLDIRSILFTFVVSSVLSSAIGIYFIRGELNISVNSIYRGWDEFGFDLISFGGWSAISLAISSLIYNADIILVRTLLGGKQTGIYTAALTISQLLWLFPRGVQSILFHNISSLYQEDKPKEIIHHTSKWLDNIFLILTLFGVGIYVLSDSFFVVYFGNDYISSVAPFKILMIGTFVFGIARVLSPIIEVSGYIRHNTLVSFLVLITNVVLNILLIPEFGLKGAAMATSISYFVKIIQYGLILQYAGYNVISDFNWIRNIALTISFFFTFRLAKELVFLPDLLELLVLPIIGFIIFVLLGVSLGMITQSSINQVKNILGISKLN